MLATILDIQRMSTEDGPGLRTTVFFKGCSLACQWCHNPESIKFGPQIQWQKHRCIGCRTCTSLCPQQALEFSPEGLKILREKCIACKSCVEDCPAGAIECKGEEMDTRRLLEILLRDKYRRLDLNWQFAEAELIPTAHMQALWQACKEASGLQETYFTGALRREE
jgi:pyruvate formate lyase activating enzyme